MSARLIRWLWRRRMPLLGAALFLALAALLAFSGGQRDRYEIEASWEEDLRALRVEQTVRLTNRTGRTLTELPLNLYPNAYLTPDRAPVPKGERGLAYPNGFDAGGAAIHAVTVAGRDAGWALLGEQETELRVQLPFALRPLGSVDLHLSYTVTLPDSRLRMGVSHRDVRLCNLFATLCAFDGESFRADGYAAVGDPFVSECADWDVTLRAPDGYVVAGAGLQDKEDGAWVFRGRGLRDCALLMSRDYCVAQAEQDGVTVRSFAFTDDGAQQALTHALRALRAFSDLYGAYPYPDFAVCAAEFYVGGMEYPGLALVDSSLYEAQDGMLEFVVAHETAHQWWYAGVGSDQVRFPWQDEALAEYSTLLYYESVYGAQSFDSLYQTLVRPATESAALRGVGVGQSLDAFESAAAYDALIYRKGAAMLHDLRVNLGNEAFLRALRKYYKDNLYSVASPARFLTALGPDGAARALAWLCGEAP